MVGRMHQCDKVTRCVSVLYLQPIIDTNLYASLALLWERYSGSPEVFNTQSRTAESLAWPLRPELVESTYMLYRATKDDTYLSFGERVIYDIANRTKVSCGLSALENVETGDPEDRMHSFVLAETLPVSVPYYYMSKWVLMQNEVPVPALR